MEINNGEFLMPKTIRDPHFARRLTQAADQHPHCPAKHAGRLGWIQAGMEAKGQPVSAETVRKWFAGEARPRPLRGKLLADLLDVDGAWLLLGEDQNLAPRERKRRSAIATGLGYLIAGLIELDGGSAAFPEEDDELAESDNIDLYVIIRGASYKLHLTAAEVISGGVQLAVPTHYAAVTVLAVMRDGFSFRLFEIEPEVIEGRGTKRGASIELLARHSDLREITGFSKRL